MNHELYNADNLKFLNSKKDELAGSVDLCYIDPPYNTGNTDKKNFTYNDCFSKSDVHSRHEVWINFMRPRLEGTLGLLKPTGIMAISIDDSEVHHLRILMDDIFGEQNFIAQMVVDGGNMKNNARFISTSHEYLLVYAKNLNALNKSKATWRQERTGVKQLRKHEKTLRKQFKNDYDGITRELKEWVKQAPLTPRLKRFYNADAKGLYTFADLSAPGDGARYEILHPETNLAVAIPTRGWGLKEEKLKALIEQDLVSFGTGDQGHQKQPLKKFYLQDSKDQVIRSILSFPSRTSTHLLEKILGERGLFNNPKNLEYMKFIIDTMTPSDGVILDYFAGSGSTGHAVLELNDKNKESERQFILCTNNENEIYDKVTKQRIEAVVSGQWLNWTYHKPKSDTVSYFDNYLADESTEEA